VKMKMTVVAIMVVVVIMETVKILPKMTNKSRSNYKI
jgi:hypothetical protein